MADTVVGIDPTTRACTLVGIDDAATREECRKQGLIIVPTTREVARRCFLETINDVYAIAAVPNG